MRTRKFDTETVVGLLKTAGMATLDELKEALGTPSTMTVFRILKKLGYLSSYSHRGQYYTLSQFCRFDEDGLWSCRDVGFSLYGNLLNTAKELVNKAQAGLTAGEIENILRIEAKHSLIKLFRDKQLHRSKIAGTYVYFSADKIQQKKQRLARNEYANRQTLGLLPEVVLDSDELKAAIILFFSLLDEQQRRLYAGLESYKLGRGGDAAISALLGVNAHTVSRGRKELFGGEVNRQGVRAAGGGRKRLEKKRRKS